MGMQNWLHWCAWFVKYLIYFLITISLMTLFFCIKVCSCMEISKAIPSYIIVSYKLYLEKLTRHSGKNKPRNMYCTAGKNIDYWMQINKWNSLSSKHRLLSCYLLVFRFQLLENGLKKGQILCIYFFLKIWPKTYPNFYEKQRYNLEWPKAVTLQGLTSHCETDML